MIKTLSADPDDAIKRLLGFSLSKLVGPHGKVVLSRSLEIHNVLGPLLDERSRRERRRVKKLARAQMNQLSRLNQQLGKNDDRQLVRQSRNALANSNIHAVNGHDEIAVLSSGALVLAQEQNRQFFVEEEDYEEIKDEDWDSDAEDAGGGRWEKGKWVPDKKKRERWWEKRKKKTPEELAEEEALLKVDREVYLSANAVLP